MKRILSAWITFALALSAHAQSPVVEPPPEFNAVGTIIFGVLFVGFCVGFMWMVWRKDKNKKE
jgi:threonine/homoserine/homoserine lactone efflux protein